MLRGDRLRKLRKKKNLSQTELGSLLGLNKATISCYENELRSPSDEHLIGMMQIFNVDADYLLGTDYIQTVSGNDFTGVPLTREEIKFIKELRKDKFVYDILIQDPLRGAQLIKSKIG